MYNHLKVDMDYCADPIWVSEEPLDASPAFMNTSLDEFDLPKPLVHSFKLYQQLWENANWSDYIGPSDDHKFPGSNLVYDLISEMEPILAAELKKVYPDSRVYFTRYGSYRLIEVGGPQITGIHYTMVN
ncbi:hypothetical protein [Erwinia phage FBB1]|nr:hypothetical protein [Erwinia phage FBB1]